MRHLRFLWLASVALGGTLHASDFAAVDIGPSLDTVIAFDTNNPGAAQTATPLFTTAGNFIRGMELTGPDTGWYVATSPSSGSPTGFFRVVNGVSTLVTPLPFESTSVGGLAFSQNEDFLLWATDPPDSRDDTLFRIDFDGTITEIGAITLPAAAVVIAALAMDPATGTLYGLETGIDAIVRIDTATGAGTVVGTGLGISASAVCGMDFSADGTNTLYAAISRNIYPIDTNTGLAGPSQGTLPFTTSTIMAIPGPVTLDVEPLAIGQSFEVTLEGGAGGEPFASYVSAGATYIPLGPPGEVRIDILTAAIYQSGQLDRSGENRLTLSIPNQPMFQGVTVWFQTALLSQGPTLQLQLTNLIGRPIQ